MNDQVKVARWLVERETWDFVWRELGRDFPRPPELSYETWISRIERWAAYISQQTAQPSEPVAWHKRWVELVGRAANLALSMDPTSRREGELILRQTSQVEKDVPLHLTPPSRERETLGYGALAEKLYEQLAALPDGDGNKGSFLPAAVCCDFVGAQRFQATLARILQDILGGPEDDS